jgi:hypothetical protein
MDNWISVKDRLPKQNELVLCYNIQRPKREPFIGRYLGGSYSETVYAFLSVHRGCSVGTTHWQPLPEPPKDNPELLKGGSDNAK